MCGCAFCSNSSSEICVLIAESNCVHASLKRRLCSLFPICCHSCEWLLLSSSAENGEIRALTSNLFSNSISPTTARNIHHHKLFNPALGIGVMFFLKTSSETCLQGENVTSSNCLHFIFSRKYKYLDTDVTICFFHDIIEPTTSKTALFLRTYPDKIEFSVVTSEIIGSISHSIKEKSDFKTEGVTKRLVRMDIFCRVSPSPFLSIQPVHLCASYSRVDKRRLTTGTHKPHYRLNSVSSVFSWTRVESPN